MNNMQQKKLVIVVSVTFCAFAINCSYLFANDSYLFAINLYCEQLIANAHKVTDTTLLKFRGDPIQQWFVASIVVSLYFRVWFSVQLLKEQEQASKENTLWACEYVWNVYVCLCVCVCVLASTLSPCPTWGQVRKNDTPFRRTNYRPEHTWNHSL